MTRIIYTDKLWFANGFTLSPSFVFIRRDRLHDTPLLHHELEHVRQMQRMGTLTFWWRYLTNKACRLALEVEAYKVQIDRGANPASCAAYLSTRYRLGINFDTAFSLLRGA